MNQTKKILSGKNIAVLVADGFEVAEYTLPVNALRLAGAKITVISLRRGRIRGMNLHEPAHKVAAQMTVTSADAYDYDGLFFPGGFINPDLLRQSAAARKFVVDFDEASKPIATLCHGPWVLASAGIVDGRTLTSWPSVRDDMINAGGTWLDQPVVRDGNWLTSRGPQDFAKFIPAMLDLFAESAPISQPSRSAADIIPSSPQRNEPPALVLEAMKWMPRPSFRGFALGLLVGKLAFSRSGTKRGVAPVLNV